MNEGGDKSPSTLVGTAPASRIATSSTGHAPVDSVDTQQAAEPVRAAQVIKTSLFRVFNFSSCFDQATQNLLNYSLLPLLIIFSFRYLSVYMLHQLEALLVRWELLLLSQPILIALALHLKTLVKYCQK